MECGVEAAKNSSSNALVTAIHNELVPTDGAASSVVRRYQHGSVVMAVSLRLASCVLHLTNSLLEFAPDTQKISNPRNVLRLRPRYNNY